MSTRKRPVRPTTEHKRLLDSRDREADWKNWGPYVSDRAWGTVREDYSPEGTAWEYFPHDHARSRAYRWNEDGIAGFCNRFQNICLGVAFWNEEDPILKERFYGLTGNEGNHGEDVKEYYYYLDSTPTHSYCKMLYKYPQVAYPYGKLVEENRALNRFDPEYELFDALEDAFRDNKYFDIFIEYAKVEEEDILCQITAVNRADEEAPLHILPHIWFRNTWSWGYDRQKPLLQTMPSVQNMGVIKGTDRHLGERWWYVRCEENTYGTLMVTENDTHYERIFGVSSATPYTKDSINDTIVNGEKGRLNPKGTGTKAAYAMRKVIPAGGSWKVQLRFRPEPHRTPFKDFNQVFKKRIKEADAFYASIHASHLSEDERLVQRQAFAGLLWTKQFYHYSVELWLDGDPANPEPPPGRKQGRNSEWEHLYNLDVISMPDKWEYPWYAAWDLAFHMIPVAMIDPEWAKRQLILMMREWYMHPNGQLPAYEWAFGDVNPPVHAWAVWRVYKITSKNTGKADTEFLEKCFHKLLLNFNWWVNRKDREDNNLFQGGFLGLDNIGVFDRSSPLPTGGYLDQADGTAWMGMYCLNMLTIALELAMTEPAYEDIATKFFEHFVYIAGAINTRTEEGLWDEEAGFFYDALRLPDGSKISLQINSFVGLIPLFAVESLDAEVLDKLPRFRRRMEWFIKYRSHLLENLSLQTDYKHTGRYLLSLVNKHQLERILQRMLDENEFLSEYGLRALSRKHREEPFVFKVNGDEHRVTYEPAESTTHLFGGNSNWRGPIWFPVNYLMIESLQKFGHFFGDQFKAELPEGSGQDATLDEIARDLSRRLIRIFLTNEKGERPFNGDNTLFQEDPYWKDHILFYEYFHGDNGRGVGASHQTGWTALVAKLIQQSGGFSK